MTKIDKVKITSHPSFLRYFKTSFLFSDRSTFQKVKSWLEEIEINCDKQPVIILVGNKTDLFDERKGCDIFYDYFAKYPITEAVTTFSFSLYISGIFLYINFPKNRDFPNFRPFLKCYNNVPSPECSTGARVKGFHSDNREMKF